MPKTFSTSGEVWGELTHAAPEPGRHLSWSERRDQLQAWLQRQPLAGIAAEEIEVHFSAMPANYWERVSESDLGWDLETIHGFLKLIATPNVPATAPYVDWRAVPPSNRTRILLCTWDRHGLLAKAAASLSAVRLNILEATAFTRADNVVLDAFSVVDADGGSTVSATRLQEMRFLLEGALSEPPRFASVWACSRHKLFASPGRFAPRIAFDNHSSAVTTLLRVEASDRLGLLYEILQTLADSGLNVTQAGIETFHDVAHDTIHLTDPGGQKVLDPRRLEELRHRLETALTVPD